MSSSAVSQRLVLGFWLSLPAAAIILMLAIGQSSLGPATSTPEGWVHVPLFGTDSWRGAYYDADSGALVYYDFGTMAGRYELVRTANARQTILEFLRKEIGSDFPGSDPLYEAMLPPEGAMSVVVTIEADGKTGNFRAQVCDDSEEQRTRAFILEQPGIRWIDPEEEEKPVHRDYDALRAGTTLQTVVSDWGAPTAIYRPNCDVLVLLYGVKLADGDHLCRLEFGSRQALSSKRCP